MLYLDLAKKRTRGRRTLYAILADDPLTTNTNSFRIILLTILGSWFAYVLYQTAYQDFFLDGIMLFAIAFVGLLVYIWTIRKDISEFTTSRKMTSFMSTSIGLIIILTNIGLFCYQDNRMNSPTLISGFNDGGFNGFHVDFKTDGHYVMSNGNGLGQIYFYGSYSITDSIIIIDKENIDNCIKSSRLVIRTPEPDFIDNLAQPSDMPYITQIDNFAIEIDPDMRFRITQDNRQQRTKNGI